MKVMIIRTSGVQEFHANWIELNAQSGNMVVQSGHAPAIILLQKHEPITIQTTSNKIETLMVRDGVVRVERTQVTILLDE